MNTSKIEIPELRKIKDAAKLTMKESFNIPKGVPQLALVDIADPLTRAFILEGLSAIGIANVVIGTDDVSGRRYAGARETLSENDLYAFDLFVYDGEAE